MGVVHIYDDTDGIVENLKACVNKPDEYEGYDIRSALYSKNNGLKVLVRNSLS